MNSVLELFREKFIARHDFEDSDIDNFLNRWKNKAIFKNIPLAWIIPLETMMFELNKRNYIVKSISQEYGQLVVTTPIDHNVVKARNIINIAIDKIKLIDQDLYLLFDIDIRKEYFGKIHNDTIAKFHYNHIEEKN